ncbi:MAG: glycosyltransferase family A protein [Chlamydiota bacterium]
MNYTHLPKLRSIARHFRCVALFLSMAISPLLAKAQDEKSIVVIIPSYNNSDWYQLNLRSVLQQKYDNYRVIYVDDHSTDDTGALVRSYLAINDDAKRVTLIENAERIGALENIYKSVWLCNPYDLVVTVDGDDWLPHENVLAFLNETYSDPHVWMTYGQYKVFPTEAVGGAEPIPQEVISLNCFREYPWVSTHLRTFYAGLFQKIEKEDFLYNNAFFPVTWDLAFMFPMLEMAGTHSKFVPDILYIYNVATPISDNKLHRELIQEMENCIRSKKRYLPIETLHN